MGAETRLAVVLFGSFVLWIPALGSVLRGELDTGVAGIRWGIGAALVWAMVAALNQLIAGYAVATTDDGPAGRATDDPFAARRRSHGFDDAVDADGVDHGSEAVDADDAAEAQDVTVDDGGAGLTADVATMETA